MPGDKDLTTVCERVYGVMFNIVIPKISHSAHPRALRYSKVPTTDRQLSSSKNSPRSNQVEEITALREVTIQRSFSDTKERDVSRPIPPTTFTAAKEREVGIPTTFSSPKERELGIPTTFSAAKELSELGTQETNSNSVDVNAKAAAAFEVGIQKSNSNSVDLNAKAARGFDVDEKADAFIRDFYDNLKKQRPGPDA